MNIESILNALLQPYIFPFFFIGMWIFVSYVLRKRSGFSYGAVDQHKNAVVIESLECTNGNIDGVNFSGVLHIYRLENGFLFRVAKLFMGGGRFISDNEILSVQHKQKLIFNYLEMKTDKSTLKFSGAAAEFITKFSRDRDLTNH